MGNMSQKPFTFMKRNEKGDNACMVTKQQLEFKPEEADSRRQQIAAGNLTFMQLCEIVQSHKDAGESNFTQSLFDNKN